MKIKMIGDSYALLVGGADPGEGGFVSLRVPGDARVSRIAVNGRSFPVAGEVCRLPVTAFATGPNRIALGCQNGKTIPCEGIRLTGGLFSPEGASLSDVIAAFDRRFSLLFASLEKLSARVETLENDSGILP